MPGRLATLQSCWRTLSSMSRSNAASAYSTAGARIALALVTLAALIAGPALAEPVVLKPDSPWNVDFAEDKCRLTRTFGDGANRHFLAFQQYWPAKDAGLTVAGPAFEKFRSLQRTDVRFFEAQQPLRTTPFTGTVGEYGRGVIYSSLALVKTAAAWAWLQGRDFVAPQDVQALAPDVLRHRMELGLEARLQGLDRDVLLQGLIAAVPAP